jgi:RND superfamily putative drug exporter
MSRRPETIDNGPGSLYRWGAFAARNRWKVLGAWIAFIVIFGGIAFTFKSEFSDAFTIPNSDSQNALDLLTERFPAEAGDQARIVFQSDAGMSDVAVQGQIKALLDTLSAMPHVTRVESPLDNPNQINTTDIVPNGNGTVSFATVHFDRTAAELPKAEIDQFILTADAAKTDNLNIELGGQVIEQVEQEPPGGETGLALLAAALVLLVAFGSVIAMGLPIVVALAGLATGFLGVFLATNFFDIATFTPGIAAMIGLGVGIDYSLFIVTRYREGLHGGLSVEKAVAQAMDTAGRAVLFAGVVVVIAILGLMAAALPFMTAYAVAVALVVGFTIAVAITLLPALLGFVGHRIDKWGIKRFQQTAADSGTSFGTKIGRRIQRNPLVYALVSTAFLLILAIPVFTINLGFTDAGANASSLHSRRAYDLLASGFGPGFNNPFLVAIESDGQLDPNQLNAVADAIRAEPGVVTVAPPYINETGDVAVISIVPAMSIQDDEAVELVHNLRDDVLPPLTDGTDSTAYVGGIAASFVDVVQKMVGRTPYFFVIVVGLSFLLLTVVFRSPVIALKAAIMNILSIGAAFGVVVAVFQWGWGSHLIGVDSELPILAFMPMFLFSILFGLSMDYEVFLLSRIRESWVNGRSTSDAVVEGLGVTARVISAAAAIMVVVFLSFVLTPDPIQKQFGIGLAFAILVDATVVRMVLVPATMELLGEWNWWFPTWLDKVIPHVNVEGSVRPVGAEATAAD